jgi:hypothetical protein
VAQDLGTKLTLFIGEGEKHRHKPVTEVFEGKDREIGGA